MRNAILWLVFGMLAAESSASPVYYTFQGTVSAVSAADRTAFAPDDLVRYVFLIDQDLPGIAYHHSVAFAIPDEPLLGNRFYFSEFISGTVEDVTRIEYGDRSYYGSERNVNGSVATTLRGSEDLFDGILVSDVRRNQVSISAGSPVGAWFLGQTGFKGENVFPAWDGSHVIIASDLALIGISDIAVPSVPEPSALALLSAGLMIFIAYPKLRKDRRPRIPG